MVYTHKIRNFLEGRTHKNIQDLTFEQKRNLLLSDNVFQFIASHNLFKLSKHEIYLRKTGNIVTITAGLDHPMIDVHHIKFMIIETMHGTFLWRFELNSESSVTLFLAHDDEIEKVYVYCSVHGLLQYTEFKWKQGYLNKTLFK